MIKTKKLPVFAAVVVSAALTEALAADTVGPTSLKVTAKEVDAAAPSELVAVMVTVVPGSSPMPDQLQLPLVLPPPFTLPVEALSVTVSSKSEKLPVFAAVVVSAALTEALAADTVRPTSLKVTPKGVF